MAKDKRLFIGGLDKDSDYRVVQPNDYVDATNIRNVLSNTGNAAGAVENIKGNTLVPFTFPLREPAQPQKTNLVIYGDEPSSGTEDLTVNITVGSNTATSVETINYSNSTPLFTALSTIRTELISSMTSNSISGITISTPAIESDSIGFSSGFVGMTFTGNLDFTITFSLTSSSLTPVVQQVQSYINDVSDYKVIGSFEDSETNSIYYFAFDKTNNDANCILEYNILENTTSVVYQDGRKGNPILNFQEGSLITGITKVGDLLSWTDDYNRPRMIDVSRSKKNETNIANAKTFTDNNFVGGFVKFIGMVNHGFVAGDLIYIVQDSGYTHESYEGVAQVTGVSSTQISTNLIWEGSTPDSPGKIMYANPTDAYSPIVSFGTRAEKLMYLDYHKHQPVHAPTYEYKTNSLLAGKNNLFGNLWQFKTRYKYTDGQYSAWSAISDIKVPLNYFSNGCFPTLDNQTDSNQIDLSYNDTIGDVEKIEIASRKGNDGEFFLVETKDNSFSSYLKRAKPSLTWYNSVGTVAETIPSYSLFEFTNNGLYPFIDKIEGDKLQDETPNKAKALTLIDGNRNAFGNYVNGYDPVDVTLGVAPLYKKMQSVDVEVIPEETHVFAQGDVSTGDPNFAYFQQMWDMDENSNVTSLDWEADTIKVLELETRWHYKDNSVWGDRHRKGKLNLTISIPASVNSFDEALDYVVDKINSLEGDELSTALVTFNDGSYGLDSLEGFEDPTATAVTGFDGTFGATSQNQIIVGARAGNNLIVRMRHGQNQWVSNVGITFVQVTHSQLAFISVLENEIYPSYKSGAFHSHGIIYYDETGKAGPVNVTKDSSFYVKSLAERSGESTTNPLNTNNEPYGPVEALVGVTSKPPSWAHHYQWVYSGNNTVDEFIQLVVEDFKFNDTITTDTRLFLSLNSFKGQDYSYKALRNPLIDYNYVEGDRVRFIGQGLGGSQTVFDTYYDFKILEQFTLVGADDEPITSSGGYWISIEDPGVTGFTEGSTANLSSLIVEIYRPKKNVSEELVEYKETGFKYPVNNPGTESRSHSVPFTILNSGDVYIKPRIYKYNASASFTNFYEDYYVNDFIDSNHYSQGRARLIDNNASEKRYSSSITYSGPYFLTSESNNLSNFNPYNLPYRDYNEGYGSIQALKTRDDGVIIFQENKISKVLVGKNIIQSPSGEGIITAATEVLSPASEYAGDYGISKNPESLVQHGYVFYFCDIKRGAVLRLSREGIIKISDANMRSFFRDKGNQYTNINEDGTTENSNNYRLKAGYDPEYDEYVVTFPQIINEDGNWSGVDTNWGSTSANWESLTSAVTTAHETVAFNELLKKWTTFYSYLPTYYGKLNRQFITFKDGKLYKQNSNNSRCNFYGVATNANIETVFNSELSSVKIYKALSLEGDNSFYAPSIKTELVTDGVSIPSTLFNTKEGLRHANIPFGGASGGGTSIAGLGTCSYTDSSDTLTNSSGQFKSLGVFAGMKVYKYAATPVLIGVINAITSDTSMTITQDSGYSGDLTNQFFYVDLKSISSGAEGERIRGQYARVQLAVPTASQSSSHQLFSASVEVESSELSNK